MQANHDHRFNRIPDADHSDISPDYTAVPHSSVTEDPSPDISAQTILISEPSSNSLHAASKHDDDSDATKAGLFSIWWQECLGAFFLAASALASFVTLYPYQGRPLPDWPYALTIGSLLSTYSVTLRLSASFLLSRGIAQMQWVWLSKQNRPLYDFVLHDEATRGPLGALALLGRLKLPRTWQWLGCILVLATLMVGPFTQQVLQYDQCSIRVDAGANGSLGAQVPRVAIFFGGGLHSGAGSISLTIAEQASIAAGLYTTGPVSATCRSGNCTFAPYKSIGYCSSCDDVSSTTSIVVVNNTRDNGIGEDTNTTTSLPSGLSVFYQDQVRSSQRDLGAAAWDGSSGEILLGMPGHPMDPATREPPSGCDSEEDESTWRCQGYGAANCSFVPCVRTYAGRVLNGDFVETIVDATPLPAGSDSMRQVYGRFLVAALDTTCITAAERDALVSAGISIDPTETLVPYNIYNATDPNTQADEGSDHNATDNIAILERGFMDRGCVYAMDVFFQNGLYQHLRGTMNGSLQLGTDSYGRFSSFDGSQFLQLIYNYGNFSLERTESLMHNISLSLTNHMRLNPGQDNYTSSIPASGTMQETKTCLRVKWAWLAFPAGIAVLTLGFFVAVAVSSRVIGRDVRTWKSSPLPLLFYGPQREDGIYEVCGGTSRHDVESMNSRARELEIRLVGSNYVDGSSRRVSGTGRRYASSASSEAHASGADYASRRAS